MASMRVTAGMAGQCLTTRGTVRVNNDYSAITNSMVFAQQQGAIALVQHQQQVTLAYKAAPADAHEKPGAFVHSTDSKRKLTESAPLPASTNASAFFLYHLPPNLVDADYYGSIQRPSKRQCGNTVYFALPTYFLIERLSRERDYVEVLAKKNQELLEEIKQELEDANELVKQQTLTTDIWQGRFDEVAELALKAGIDSETISEIRYRRTSTGR